MALGLFTSKSPTQDHTLANLAGPEREHEIVHGAKVLEVTAVSAVLLRWLMERPVSLEPLASLVRFCHHCENRRCRVTRCNSDSNCGGSSAQLQVFSYGDVCRWTVLTCGHTVYLQRTTREQFDRRVLAA